MTVHLIKLCVGIENVEHLAQVQQARLDAARARGEKKPQLLHITRNMPRRSTEVLDGGSLYWVIKGVIQVRQRILALEQAQRDSGEPACAIIYEPTQVRTEPRAFRAFQGWRYFPPDKAPPDLDVSAGRGADLPPAMAAELRDLGLL
ncbi:MAG: DUF1489 domain-containing protein [Rhodospirillaceae bacterium]